MKSSSFPKFGDFQSDGSLLLPSPPSVVNNHSEWKIRRHQVYLEDIRVEKAKARKAPKLVELLREEGTSELTGNELSGFGEK